MSKNFDLDPQEVLMRAYLELEKGWVKGKLKGPGQKDRTDGQDPQGVCLLGSLDEAIGEILQEQIDRSVSCPEGTNPELFRRAVSVYVLEATRTLRALFQQALERRVGSSVPHWNDTFTRKKPEVLEAMRLTIEDMRVMVVQQDAADREKLAQELFPSAVVDRFHELKSAISVHDEIVLIREKA